MGSMPPPPTPPRAAELARGLLGELGHEGLRARLPDRTTLEDYADSGLLHLTGPRRPRGLPATAARAVAAALAAIGRERFGAEPAVDGAQLLGERAALAGTEPPHPGVSSGGRARFLRCLDGWWVLHLARDSDVELVPALVEREVGTSLDDTWTAAEEWSATVPVVKAVDRAVLLGIPAAAPGETPAPPTPWSVLLRTPAQSSAQGRRVVNLGSLWAGPLAAHLLGLLGFEVIHVESLDRPDASRWGDPGLHELLHRDAAQVALDFGSAEGRSQLRDLLHDADVVIEASRPRALEALGLAPHDVLADGRARTWLSITGHGPAQPMRVGFGDDAAVAGGLVAEHPDGSPAFCGDALADPLGGLTGALAVAGLHDPTRITHASVALAGVAAWCRALGDVEWTVDLPAPRPPRVH